MGRIWKDKQLLAAVVLFAVFIANVVIGKIAILGGATTVPGLGDVGEFLVLFAAVVLFIAVCLRREAAAEREVKNNSKEKGEGDVQ